MNFVCHVPLDATSLLHAPRLAAAAARVLAFWIPGSQLSVEMHSQHEPPPREARASQPAAVRHLSGGPSDEEIVRRITEGDRWAEEALYRRYVNLVGATALRLLRNRAEAEDVVQETFLLAFQSIHQLRDVGALRAWLVRIAVSRVKRRFRWNQLRRLFSLSSFDDEGLAEAAADDASGEDRAELALIDQALAPLKETHRTAWLLRHAVGCSLEEVAEACGCSLAAAKRRIKAADEHIDRHIQRGGRHGT
jgi:RNA polymerase sigma-70 factor (ECF subfamily)